MDDETQIAVAGFVRNVMHFCEWIEADAHDAASARQLLLSLMGGISALDIDCPDRGPAKEYERRGHARWMDDHKRLQNFPIQYYRISFDPLAVESEESVVGDVHDDLADIYGDLWHGLQAFNGGDQAYALDYWRTSYDQHWGRHAAGAVFAIDAYFRS